MGRSPTAECGTDFRATVWSWKALHRLICLFCGDLLGEELLRGMARTDGKGPTDGETCLAMAERFLEGEPVWRAGFGLLNRGLTFDEIGLRVDLEEQAWPPELWIKTQYFVSAEEVRAWIEFLRCCGGFAVY